MKDCGIVATRTHTRTHARTHTHTHQIKYLLRFKHSLLSSFRFSADVYCDINRFTSTCTMSTQLIFSDPKLAKLVDKINKLLRNRKSINEVQFSCCVIINVGTHVGTKSVKIMFKVHAFCENLHLADNYTSAIYILIRQVISKKISFQNLTSCSG